MIRPLAAVAALALALTGCVPRPAQSTAAVSTPAPTPAATATPQPTATPSPDGVDLDLTRLSATMVFAEVAAMVRTPEDYLGKTVRMAGPLAVYEANPALGIDYFYTVVIQDATACCQQGMEFIWPEGTLPEAGTGLVVTGTFAEYDCGGLPSYHIVADTVEITA